MHTRKGERASGRKLVTGPATEPVTLGELKAHLRVDADDEDALLNALITAARMSAEARAWRPFITQTWDVGYDGFPTATAEHWRTEGLVRTSAPLSLPLPPLQEVVSVTYIDTDGDEQTLDAADYQVDDIVEPARLAPVQGTTWPETDPEALRPVTVRIKAGYGDAADDVPQHFRQAVLLIAATLYEHRENVVVGHIVHEIPGAADALIDLGHARGLLG